MRVDPEVLRYLESQPVLCVGQADDLAVETTVHIPDEVPVRVWLSRVDRNDVSVEFLHRGSWVTSYSGNLYKMLLRLALEASGYTGGGL
jgi:hypothetical protein